MSSTLPKHWPAMVFKFRSLIWGLEQQMEAGEFDSLKFEAGWMKLHGHGFDILRVLSKPPAGEWPKTLKRLRVFHEAVERLMATCHEEGRPEPMAKVLARCNRCAGNLINGGLLTYGEPVSVPEPKDGPAIVEEPKLKKGKGGRKKILTERKFKAYEKKFPGKLASVSLKELSKYWRFPTSTIARHDYWKYIMESRKLQRKRTQDKSESKTPKGKKREALASKNRQEEVEEERDRKLDRL